MADDYDKFKANMDRYQKDTRDREDAEKWRHQEESRAASREKKPEEPEKKKETVPAEHPFKA